MQVKILGSAAGGGFPQWNCACSNCLAVRHGKFPGKARLQTQLAVSHNGDSWFLLGASPDLRLQIEGSPELHPRSGTRSSPIHSVVLTSADVDHVLGLLLLRELQPFAVYATKSVIEILCCQNSLFSMLNRVPDQVCWKTISAGESFHLGNDRGEIPCASIPVSSRYPAYAARVSESEDDAVILGLILTADSGAKLGFFPQLPSLTPELLATFSELDLLLLDGTFWSDDELIRFEGSGQTAREMGHIPVGGKDGTQRQLSSLIKPRKMYIHINNTNPMLNQASPEYRQVREAGWEVAEDGCHFNL
jgi:pyrroloquinoline quinone biosynthesis protein B